MASTPAASRPSLLPRMFPASTPLPFRSPVRVDSRSVPPPRWPPQATLRASLPLPEGFLHLHMIQHHSATRHACSSPAACPLLVTNVHACTTPGKTNYGAGPRPTGGASDGGRAGVERGREGARGRQRCGPPHWIWCGPHSSSSTSHIRFWWALKGHFTHVTDSP